MILEKGIKWLVYSNVWVSANVVALYTFITMVTTIPFSSPYALLVFFSTLFAYNFQRLLKTSGSASNPKFSDRHDWIEDKQLLIMVLSVIGFVGMSVLALYELPFELLLSSIPALIIVVFYTRRNDELKALRNLPFLKIFLISIVWLFVVLIIPVLLNMGKLSDVPKDLFMITFLYVFLLCIPFDIRDVAVDRGRLKTIPIVLGIRGSKVLGVILMLIIALMSYFGGYSGMILVSISVIPSIIFSNESRRELFYSGWIEGQFVILLLLQILVDVI